jgi:hypothetical protein
MATLTADQILSANDSRVHRVEVPEWGGEVHIRVMSVGERDSYERLWIGKSQAGIENFRTEYLARVLCDDKGSLLFTRDQIDKLSTKNGDVMGRLFDLAMKHNKMTEGDVEELGKS